MSEGAQARGDARRRTHRARRAWNGRLDHGVVMTVPPIREYRTLSPEALDALERAVRDHRRVALRRRGTEYVVVAERLETSGRDDVLAGRLPMTGESLSFPLRDLESFAVLP